MEIVRVLFVTSPGLGHVFPTISLAHALRAAGHEVLVATAGGKDAANAGLPVVDSAPGVDISAVFEQAASEQPEEFDFSTNIDTEKGLAFIGAIFARVSGISVDVTVSAAESWRPDVVVHSPLQGAGPLVAAKLGVPAVTHGIGFADEAAATEAIFEKMVDERERHGVTALPEVRESIDVAPPSMVDRPVRGWPMRYVPYNGGGVLPEWVLERPARPRVAVTLGTVLTQFGALTSLTKLVDVARNLDAEFVLALGDADPSPLGELPDNVRAAGWVPLSALLPTSSALVHHGGAGSTLTAIAAGVPQLVLPHGADQYLNADVVARRGLGLRSEPDQVDAELINRLLTDTGLSSAASEVAEEIIGLPTPADLVPKITGLV
ncbi:UDP:flavonoid glycosyltransferase YjiC (YdhE family) [Herbihabitans rhizosphaerae]|uniref:UDP:flavonoid glycosyltransferase YjiC (YdhE family) n=1 Tax=Herbihabitans rhizosphaerae TaxID=1872711 RepID=A0A4Q7KLB6_9PSEU|nr:UDP:flavonoid glycosyltransferase YjiC (YdhE family) [Herbihabitans rhizosphaerae]